MGAKQRGLAVGAVIVAMAVGCGGSHGSSDDVQTLLAGTTTALDAAHTFRITLDGTGSEKGQSETLHGEGIVDWSAGTVDLHITGAGQNERMIITPGAAYVHGALSTTALASTHRSWLMLPGKGHANGQVLGDLDPIGDPLTTLSSLRNQLSDVTSAGTTLLDGVSTTELKGSLAKFGDLKGGASLTAWIDQQGRVRQLRMVATGDVQADITERFSDFGLPVHVIAPPANDVVNINKLLKQAFKNLPPSDLPSPPGFLRPARPAHH